MFPSVSKRSELVQRGDSGAGRIVIIREDNVRKPLPIRIGPFLTSLWILLISSETAEIVRCPCHFPLVVSHTEKLAEIPRTMQTAIRVAALEPRRQTQRIATRNVSNLHANR